MNTPRLFWFFEARMTLWGLGLGAWLGAMYGFILGAALSVAFPPSLLIGPLLGGAYGAIAGLPLGIMEGAVLWAFTLYFYRGSKPGDTSRYLRRARYVCVGACVLVPLPIIEFLARRSGPSLVTGAYDSSDVIMLLIVLLIPIFIAACAVWWAVKRVAARFIREVGEQVNPSPGQTSHGGSIETGLNQ